MNAMQIRLEMTELGWYSEDRLTDMGWRGGKFGYSIWFSRWNWHGQRTDKATYHAHTADLDAIDETVEKAANLAKKAWDEFPTKAPHQLMPDELRVDP